MEYVRRNWFVYIILAISFYVFPLIVKNTGIAMLVMLIAIPAICFGFSVIYGIRNGFHWWYALVVAALFFPTIFIFYNSSAWIYVVAYAVISLVGNLVGWPFYKNK